MDKFTKQSSEVLDYDIDFTDFLVSGDALDTATADYTSYTDGDTSLTLGSTTVNVGAKTIKQWISAGTSGNSYKITVTATTTGGRVKEVDFKITIKDI